MITLYQNIDAEFDVGEPDIIDIFSELSYTEMMEYWVKAHGSNGEKPQNQYCYDVLFDEWFEKVKQQYSLQEAENLIKVR